MTGDSEPSWDLLPLQPETFFGLEGDFDLRDLKRRYNTLLRRFKPEKFPEQFQRIRSAYETLHDALRYEEEDGIQFHREKTQFDWNAPTRPQHRPPSSDRREEQEGDRESEARRDAQADSDVPSSGSSQQRGPGPSYTQQDDGLLPTVEQRPLHQRVAEEPPEALYREFRNRQPKTPFDYYALAVLSDVVEDDPLSFPRWLLQGLKEHPNEQGLFHLLREHFASDPPPGTVAELLKGVSQIVRGDRFYYLTERLWDRLLREVPFKTFRRTLEACEANLLNLGGVLLVSLAALAILLYFDAWLPRRYYRGCWRNFIMMFLQSSPIPLPDLADDLEGLNNEKVNEKEMVKTDAIAELLRKDIGLSFYVTAQRLMV